ncbi:3D domain-containing protein [Candidatus Binatia bacterium]|jgi:3D (Asp-Asp-Asp) domain-containing protein|nr:3D domain-containing protein [Candidatus Binatia bacterium]
MNVHEQVDNDEVGTVLRTRRTRGARLAPLAALVLLSACATHETAPVAAPDAAAQAATRDAAARAQQSHEAHGDTELFDATAYSIEGKTASGKQAREGICAADPDVLPLGSRVRVHDAGEYSGECEIADTGRAIKGREIDIYLASDREAKQFGKKKVRVEKLSSAK